MLTNSLGATDEPLVHLGYSRYREEMLRLGVDLYELSQQRVKRNMRMFHFGESLGRLHAKLVVIDRERSFIGSMNFDPRSATINTELGALVLSPQLARELTRVIDGPLKAPRVRLRADGGGLEWLGFDNEKEMVLSSEPDDSSGCSCNCSWQVLSCPRNCCEPAAHRMTIPGKLDRVTTSALNATAP